MTSTTPAPRFPQVPFEQYQELKQDVVTIAMCLARAVADDDTDAVTYWHKQLVELATTIEQLRAWILREPEPME